MTNPTPKTDDSDDTITVCGTRGVHYGIDDEDENTAAKSLVDDIIEETENEQPESPTIPA